MKRKKVIITISIIIGFIALCAGAFYGTYYFSINKSSNSYIKTISKLSKEINKVNLSEKSFLGDNGIPNTVGMNESISSLTKVQSELNTLVATSKYKKYNKNLKDGLKNNILLYKQINAIADNPTGNDVENSLQNLKTYRDNTINFYSLVDIPNVSLSLSNETITLINSLEEYVTENLNLKRENEIKQSQQLEFIDKLETIISKYAPIKVNYSVNIALERTGSKNYDKIINSIINSQNTIADIKKDLSNISVTQEGKPSFEKLKKSIDTYDSYLTKIKYAILTEKAQVALGEITENQISKWYKNPDSQYKLSDDYYADFSKLYNQYKINAEK